MSLSSTGNIKHQLTVALGFKGPHYFTTLQLYLRGQISRTEFDEQVRECLDTALLVQLHNSLIISLFDITSHLKAQPLPATVAPSSKPPLRKRRRTLPHSDVTGPNTFRSARLKKWALGVGKRERERLGDLDNYPLSVDRPLRDEIAQERGVFLLNERGEPPGTRLPLHLASITRAPTLQHIWDRMNLVSAQHDLSAPPKQAASLMMLAFETKLKQLITQAITLTTSSQAITTINPSISSNRSHVLTASAFDTLFTLCPAVLPNQSAAAMRFSLGDVDAADDLPQGREVGDQRWQIFGLLAERSTLKHALRNS